MKQPSSSQLKRWSKLGRRKHREKERLFIAEGERCIFQIMENGIIEVESLIVRAGEEWDDRIPGIATGSRSGKSSGRTPDMNGHRMDIYTLAAPDFNRLADTDTPQGILAVCRMPDEPAVSKLSESRGLIVATDSIRDPGNFGTIVRTSVWFGVCGILAGSGSVDPWNPKVVRSTVGATGVVPIVSGDLEILLSGLESAGWEILLLDGGGESTSLTGLVAGDRTVVVVGNEAEGIQKELFKPGRRPVRIPSRPGTESSGGVESLNAATALGIALFVVSG